MTYPFYPKGFLGRPLRLVEADEGGPLRGNDVIALQTSCGIERDGVFGRKTDIALRALQGMLGVKVDGVCGPGTDRAFCLRVLLHAAPSDLIAELVQGIIEGESGYRPGAQSPTYIRTDGRRADLGAVQFSTLEADESSVLRALDATAGINRLCQHLKEKRNLYLISKFVAQHRTPERIAGWLACGSWNAPAWTDVWAARGPDDPYLQRTVTLQNGTPGTREQWVRNYVASKIGYVTSWT